MLQQTAIRTGIRDAAAGIIEPAGGVVLRQKIWAEFPEAMAPFLIPTGGTEPNGWFVWTGTWSPANRFKKGQGVYTFKFYGLRQFANGPPSSADALAESFAGIFTALVDNPTLGVDGAYLKSISVDQDENPFQADIYVVSLYEATLVYDYDVSC